MGKLTQTEVDAETNFLMEHEGTELIKQFNLPIVESGFAENVDEAKKIASDIGYPVVLKGMSRQIIHKSEAGIVQLNINNEDELKDAYEAIEKNAKAYDADARLAGIFVQKMAPSGTELIFGVKRDAIFGHQLIIGLGGIFVEVFKDFAIRMFPVSEQETEEMLAELTSYPILSGYRNQEGINLAKVKEIVAGLNELIKKHPDIEELDLNPVIFTEDEGYVCDVRIAMNQQEEEATQDRSLKPLDDMFNPKSIAVIGASSDEKKNGGRLFKYIAENKYDGDLYPVNPTAKEIKGYKAYPSIKDIPGDVDLACIIVAAKIVPTIMRDCIEKGVKAAIIYSSGFAEVGEEGEKLQDEVLQIAKEGGIRVLGPNSIGIASPEKNIYTAFGAALESDVKVPGNVGFVSQSGAMGSALLSRAWENKIGFSRWISVANEMDLSATDFIEYLAEDELTNVISVFMEALKDADSFARASQKALANDKPLVVFKTGRSEVGKRAVQSHTGSIAGDDQAYSTAFEKYQVLQVSHLEDLVDVSIALDVQPTPKGNKIGILTASGGASSVLADLCSELGMEVPPLVDSKEQIEHLSPPFGSAQNPIDVTAEIIAQPEMFKQVLESLVNDADIDAVIVMLTTNADPGALIIAQAITEVFEKSDKPIVVGRLGADMIAPKAMKYYADNKFPVYETPEKVVNVMHYLVKYSELINKS